MSTITFEEEISPDEEFDSCRTGHNTESENEPWHAQSEMLGAYRSEMMFSEVEFVALPQTQSPLESRSLLQKIVDFDGPVSRGCRFISVIGGGVIAGISIGEPHIGGLMGALSGGALALGVLLLSETGINKRETGR